MANIAVVEDDPIVRELIQDALEDRDHTITSYGDVASAYAGLVPSPPDLLVCDVDLPDGTGLELIGRLHKVHPGLPVLIQSGRNQETDLIAGFEAGAADYITKPISVPELLAKCAVMLARANVVKGTQLEQPGHDLPGGLQEAFGRYRLEGVLGQGGFGTVFAAQDLEKDRPVALKVLPALASLQEEARQRFIREAYSLSMVKHPQVAKVYDFGTQEGRSYFTMQRIEGTDLDALVKERGPAEEGRVKAMLSSLAGALEAVHARSLVHRDLKPGNVILRGESFEDPVLVDFGLAKHPEDHSITKSGTLMGTPYYLAPELIEGRAVDGRSDLYSLGLVARFALTGEVLHGGLDLLELLRRIASKPVPMPESLSAPFRAVLERLVEREPDRRPASAKELRLALASLP